MSKRILFLATDPVGSESIRTDLTAIEAGWETFVVGTFDEAVAAIEARLADVIVADHHLTDASGAKLLNWAAEHLPKAPRLIMAEASEREQVLRLVLTPHHFLPKPVAPDVLRGTIQSALLLDRALPNEVLLTLASRIQAFPPMPSLYFRVLNELKSPDFSAQTVGEILARDLAMTTRLLQVINSGFYSLPRRITDLTEAVNLLGQEAVKSLIIGIHLFLEHEHIKPLYFSISQVWRHSTAVAQGARLIMQMETGDPGRADEAYTAGLLHDIGKLVLANNFESQYNKVQKAARDSGRPLWEAETEEFGVSHAELGAFILGRWGMPVGLLEATALHHQPGRLGSQEFSALTAVHIANAIEHELHRPGEENIPSTLDQPYIESLRLTELIDGWKECVRNGKVSSARKPSPKSAAKGVAVASSSDVSPSSTQPRPTRAARTDSPKKKWLSAVAATAAATTVMASLGWFLGQHWPGQESQPARARSRPDADASNGFGDPGSIAPSGPTAETNATPSDSAEPAKPKEKPPEI